MKIDIKISRSLTINAGEYESVRPAIELTLKDIDTTKVADAYQQADDVLAGLLRIEVMKCTDALNKARGRASTTPYCIETQRNIESIGLSIETALAEISKLG